VVVAVTGVTFFVVNALLVLPARREVGRTPAALFGTWSDNGLEVATLCLGALNALTVATLPGLAVLVLPPVLLLHRTVLVKQLEVAAPPRREDGPLQRGRLAGAGRKDAGGRGAPQRHVRVADAGPGPFQAGQRHVWPSGR
jgi:hypothetical protein